MLASWDLSSAQRRHVAFALQAAFAPCESASGNSGIPGCHPYGASRVTSGGKSPCMMVAFTASRHFMATLGAPRPRRSGRNGNCSPTRVASSTRCCRRAVAVSTNSLLEDSRTSPAPNAWLCAHEDGASRGFFRCAHDQQVQEKQTLRLNRGTTDSHPTEEDTKASFQKVDRVNEHSHMCRK